MLSDYDKAVRLDPKDAIALCGRGDTYAVTVDYHEAIADYTAVIALMGGASLHTSGAEWPDAVLAIT